LESYEEKMNLGLECEQNSICFFCIILIFVENVYPGLAHSSSTVNVVDQEVYKTRRAINMGSSHDSILFVQKMNTYLIKILK